MLALKKHKKAKKFRNNNALKILKNFKNLYFIYV